MTSAATLICPSCGSEEPESSRFCGTCGTPFAPAGEQPARTESVDESTPAEAMAPDPPTDVAPPHAWPQRPPSETAPLPPVAATPPVRRRVRPVVLIASLLLLVAAATAAALFGTGAIGGSSVKSDSAFVHELNQNVLGPLDQADATAADNARTSEGALTRAADGGRIVRVADEASARLRALSGLSGKQRDQVQVLLTLVAANRLYGQSFGAYTPEDIQGQLALDQAAAAARAVIASAENGLPAELQLPAQAAFISLRPPSTPSSTTSATPPASASAVVYVGQVDRLLRQSHAVVLALNSFVPRAASGAISRSGAVTLARSYADQRRLELAQARALTVPLAFAPAHGLLIRALEASLADDQALVAWTVARRDGSGNAKAEFDRANRIGTQATALKRQFLRAYGQQRQAATGRSPASLPDIF